MGEMLTVSDVRNYLRAECDEAGGQTAWAKAHGLSGAYVCDVLSTRREPGDAILSALGLRRVVYYEDRR